MSAPLACWRPAHASDHVFDELARAILTGVFAPGTAMPPERLLVEQFGVSRIIARQALHRLAELGLVRVRQGGATIVLDPAEASDLRVLALYYRLANPDFSAPKPINGIDPADIIEKQYLQGLSIVEVAARRASTEELLAISDLVQTTEQDPRALANFALFEERFWRALAIAGKNRVFRMEVGWWYEALKERPVPPAVANADPLVRIGFYKELARRLIAADEPVGYYIVSIRALLDGILGPPQPRTMPQSGSPTPEEPRS